MGFSDTDFWKAKEAGVSNSQLYKQAGNGVTVNVIEAIGMFLQQVDAEIRAEDEKTKR